MYQNDAIVQNTLHVNDMLVRIFKLLLVAIIAAAVLKATGIIVLTWLYLVVLAFACAIVCTIPIACRHFRMDPNIIKYVSIYCAEILCIAGYCGLDRGITVLLIIPVGFACMYFDIKLIRNSIVLLVLGFVLGEAASSLINLGFDLILQYNYIRIALNFLQVIIGISLLVAVSRRALAMLSNTHSFYENINNIFSNMQGSTQSLEAAEEIILQGVSSLAVSKEKIEEAPYEEAVTPNAKVRDIISNINKSMENAKDLIKYTQGMLKGKGKELKPGDEIEKLEEYSRNSKELVSKLSNYTDKIKEDLSLIAIMIDESKLLSLNASAEAENASAKGKGSVITAMKVEKLANESTESAIHIQELLSNVVNDAENTVKSVAETYEEIFKSLELINRTVETLVKWLMYKNMN